MAGRAPYRCLWCKKRSYLPAQEYANDVPVAAAKFVEREPAPVPTVVPVQSRRETTVPDSPPMRAENGRQKLSEAATMTIEPESAPAPALPRPEIRVPDSPPMYAENGRLRLSGITLEQIQWRDSRVRRPKSSPRARNESNG